MWLRCEAAAASEDSIDPRCAHDLIARGPLAFGRGWLVLSFVFGIIVLCLLVIVDRSGATSVAAIVLAGIGFVVGLPLVYRPVEGAGAVQTAVVVGLVGLFALAVLARRWGRSAIGLLSALYVAGWIALLSWNAAEARRLAAIE